LPLNWFRRRTKKQEEEQQEALTQPVPPADAPPEPEPQAAEDAATDGEAQRKRRRGTRGGRNRKRKPATATAEQATAEEDKKPEKKPARGRQPAREKREKQDRSTRSRSRRRQQTKRAPLPAAKRELLVSAGVTERRVAVLEDDKVAEVYLERPDRRSIAGNIYLGTVDNVLPGMEAAFVDIGLEKNGFLYVDEIVTPELEGKRHHGKRIQDLLSRGQTILVQAVKDPMKTKGARLTTEVSLAGRFVVYVPSGEGFGVSRRLEDDERIRLREILKSLDVKKGGVIVRTAAEGASAEDIERDFEFLARLWKTIETRANSAQSPALVYQEAELPLRVTRDLFTEDFERALIDDDRTYRRIVGYLKKTSPHMAERVVRHRSKTPLMEEFGVDREIKSTLSRRVDLPSGGYLVFDYAEAFTVIDVNTGRFVGSRSKSSTQTLEDTITKNNIEAVKEVVRQLRLRDIGGIIVIDFIDMANPKNRATVEEALRQELERDRTKTYVVEISPLGLVEMTRQNVTDGPREILAKKCPVCAGDGIVVSEQTAAVELEQRLRTLVKGSRSKVYRVEVNAHVASVLIGPGARRLAALEEVTKRRFVVEGRDDVPHDHLEVLAHGATAEPEPGPVAEGADVNLKLVEIGRYDAHAGVGKVDGFAVVVADGSSLIGKKVQARLERVMNGVAFATLLSPAPRVDDPITAESEAERPTRSRRRTTAKAAVVAPAVLAEEAVAAEQEEAVAEEPAAEAPVVGEEQPAEETTPKKKTRRGTRGGRNRRKKPAASVNGGAPDAEAPEAPAEAAEPEPVEELAAPAEEAAAPAPARIHLPPDDLGEVPATNGAVPAEEAVDAVAAADREEQPKPKKRTRRGTRGGRNRKRKPAGAAAPAEPLAEQPAPE
jgi:ribonuclease G